MPVTAPCPACGTPRPADGPCPACLLKLGLDGDALSLSRSGPAATVDLTPGALETIAQTIGPVPRVLLRDTAPGEPPSPVVTPAPADPTLRYRIDGEIARGGMGAVLKGRDPDLNREVALKVLRDDYRDHPEMVRRFVEEAQIGGQLQHPGIVPIYELGTMADRRPFFSMKLVKGRTLAQILAHRPPASPARVGRQAHEVFPPPPGGRAGSKGRSDGGPRPRPADAGRSPAASTPPDATDDGPRTTDQGRLLAIFESICQTLAYAHARGVIHRDLKPSNVMVGAFGEVQVMDWGLAKVLPRGGVADDATAGHVRDVTVVATDRGDTDASRAGSIMGTPAYMSPEQARGEVDAVDQRADVFALGSILCEILTGAPAFTGRTAGEIQAKAARGDLSDALARLAPATKDREGEAPAEPRASSKPRREDGSAGASPSPVPRSMDELATLARDCPAPERDARPRDASEVARRVTAYLTGVQDRLRQAELDRARAEAKAVEERKRRRVQLGLAASVAGFTLLGAVGLAVFASVVQSQKQALARANPDLAKANSDLTAQRARAETREQQAIDAVKRFRDAVADNPMLKNSPELEDLRKTLLKEPLAFFKSLREQLQADNDTRPEALARLAAAAFDLGYLTDEIGDKPDAIRAYDAAREIFERLARDHPAVTAYAQDLARTHNNLGNLLATTGDPAGARRAYEAAREIFERLARDHPEMPGYASALGATLNNLAMLDLAARRWLPARALLKQAITWQKQALAANLRHPEYRQSLGMHLRNLIQAADALGNDAEIADAWRELAELAASDPARAVLETRLAAVIGGETPRDNAERLALAQRAYDTQRYALAARLWGEALEDDPTLADDRQRQHRYNAACAAALAAALASGGRQPPDASMPGGAGEPSRGGSGGLHPPLAEEGAALRARALGWLRAELEIWARIVDTDEPPGRALVAQTLTHWQGDPDLASVRGEAIDAFPEGEREGWRAMWAEVERLRERAGSDGSSG